MVMPTFPRPHLVVGQARFALGPLQAFFDPVLRLEHPGELRQRGVERRLRQQVVVLPRAVPLPFALLAPYWDQLIPLTTRPLSAQAATTCCGL